MCDLDWDEILLLPLGIVVYVIVIAAAMLYDARRPRHDD